jgi:hypothetical protein
MLHREYLRLGESYDGNWFQYKVRVPKDIAKRAALYQKIYELEVKLQVCGVDKKADLQREIGELQKNLEQEQD